MLSSFCVILLFQTVLGRQGFGYTDQEWGYANVRTGANLFWWLHYTTADVSSPTEKPLIIWLQGGPGASSTGYGNFAELGPLDENLQNRSSTWVQWANVMFVDNPVGCGFGFVENDQYAKNNTQIAQDFLVFLKGFYNQFPQFQEVPLYIFCESYGGKMTAEIALVLYRARQNGEIVSNFKGIGLGDSWISPVDSVLTYAPYLLNLGAIDRDGYNDIMRLANTLKFAVDTGDFLTAVDLWGPITDAIEEATYGIDFYNVLEKTESFGKMRGLTKSGWSLKDIVDNIMNNQVKQALNLSTVWYDQNQDVFDALALDFMKPVTSIVEELLNTTDLTVAVYNGQLDLIVDTPGTIKWVEEINFREKDLWLKAPREGFAHDGFYEGYVKKYGNFSFYWVDRSGHMVPHDNPSGMYYILKDVTNNFKV